MNFPISGTHIAPLALILVGFIIGVFGGFFGVGGSFLAAPALFFLRVPMNFVVGTDLAHLVGKSVVAVRKHSALKQIDYKLGCLMMIGTLPGVELGARLIERLKRKAEVTQVVGTVFIVILVAVSAFMAWEASSTYREHRRMRRKISEKESDRPALGRKISAKIQKLPLRPFIALPRSGIARVSLWSILIVALGGGFLSGFLGGGAGYVRMPSLIYLLGVPTHIAIGTDLFEVVVSAGYGTVTHALKGNVDILIALVMHTGAAIGAQIGAVLTRHVTGTWIRLAFVPLPLLGAGFLLFDLLHGKH